ncbi:MAG: mechanosensitive ion channel [Ktedonobacteraceae bacterium]|nr:mechanosensitive ion channel [Ktedonobacteraceae bacterium]
MTFSLHNQSSIGLLGLTVDQIISIAVSTLTILTTLGIGLVLRRIAIRRLQKTVLDNWVIQTIGVLVVILPVVLGTIGALAIYYGQALEFVFTSHNPLIVIAWRVIGTVIVIALGIGAARTVRALTIRGLGENRIDINIRTLIGRIFYITAMIFAAFIALAIWQISIDIPIAVIGALTVASTVAFQDILKNLLAGFYILVERPFFIGDQINIVSGMITYIGRVEDIQLRTTKLRLTTGEEVAIPNMLVFSNAVVNNTRYGERRAVIAVTLPQDEFSPEQTPEQIRQALRDFPEVMTKPDPQVLFSSLKEQKITLMLRFWIGAGHDIDISQIMYQLHALLPQADLAVKEPPESV